MELVDHTTQKTYSYPKGCPKCDNINIVSQLPGVEELKEKIKTLDASVKFEVSNRVFDPAIDYTSFDKIVFIQAENLTASMDYLVSEDIVSSLVKVMSSCTPANEIIFDTRSSELWIFDDIKRLSLGEITLDELYNNFLKKEAASRERFGFPPYKNIILVTSHNKKNADSYKLSKTVYEELKTRLKDIEEIELYPPYPAKMLKRVNMYSYHFIIKYPKKYTGYSKLRDEINSVGTSYGVQIRLNPRNLL